MPMGRKQWGLRSLNHEISNDLNFINRMCLVQEESY